MKIVAPVFILFTLLAACEPQNTLGMGHPMGMEDNEMNEGMEGNEAGENH